MYLSRCEDFESVVMFNGGVRSCIVRLMGDWENQTLSFGIQRKYWPIKRGFLLVQHYEHDLDVL